MSRQAAAAALALLISVPAGAQDGPPVTAEEALEAAENAYGPPAPETKTCPTAKSADEIVVCAEEQEQSQFRYSDNEAAEDRYARATMDKGAPRAPDVGTNYPGVVVARGCFIPPCPPPKALLIDLKAIPEAPPGSDADRVGRGLAPRGNEGPAPLPEPVIPPESASPAEQPQGWAILRAAPAPRSRNAPALRG